MGDRHGGAPGPRAAAPVAQDPEPARVASVLAPERVDVLRGLAARGGPGLINQLVDCFVESADSEIPALTAADQRGDREQVADLAHKLRGAARSLGAFAVAELCAEVEAAAVADTSAEPLIDQLERAVDGACLALEELCDDLLREAGSAAPLRSR